MKINPLYVLEQRRQRLQDGLAAGSAQTGRARTPALPCLATHPAHSPWLSASGATAAGTKARLV